MKLNIKTIAAIFVLLPLTILTSSAFAIPNGSKAPEFTLISVEGKAISLKDYAGKMIVLEWFNYGCPFVRKQYKDGFMQSLQKEVVEKSGVWLTINSTEPQHKNFLTPEKAKAVSEELKMNNTAMLTDVSGEVGKLYNAKTTPHMFLIDVNGNIVYQGAFDDKPDAFDGPEGATNYVRNAIADLKEGRAVKVSDTEAYGCSVKYKE